MKNNLSLIQPLEYNNLFSYYHKNSKINSDINSKLPKISKLFPSREHKDQSTSTLFTNNKANNYKMKLISINAFKNNNTKKHKNKIYPLLNTSIDNESNIKSNRELTSNSMYYLYKTNHEKKKIKINPDKLNKSHKLNVVYLNLFKSTLKNKNEILNIDSFYNGIDDLEIGDKINYENEIISQKLKEINYRSIIKIKNIFNDIDFGKLNDDLLNINNNTSKGIIDKFIEKIFNNNKNRDNKSLYNNKNIDIIDISYLHGERSVLVSNNVFLDWILDNVKRKIELKNEFNQHLSTVWVKNLIYKEIDELENRFAEFRKSINYSNFVKNINSKINNLLNKKTLKKNDKSNITSSTLRSYFDNSYIKSYFNTSNINSNNNYSNENEKYKNNMSQNNTINDIIVGFDFFDNNPKKKPNQKQIININSPYTKQKYINKKIKYNILKNSLKQINKTEFNNEFIKSEKMLFRDIYLNKPRKKKIKNFGNQYPSPKNNKIISINKNEKRPIIKNNDIIDAIMAKTFHIVKNKSKKFDYKPKKSNFSFFSSLIKRNSINFSNNEEKYPTLKLKLKEIKENKKSFTPSKELVLNKDEELAKKVKFKNVVSINLQTLETLENKKTNKILLVEEYKQNKNIDEFKEKNKIDDNKVDKVKEFQEIVHVKEEQENNEIGDKQKNQGNDKIDDNKEKDEEKDKENYIDNNSVIKSLNSDNKSNKSKNNSPKISSSSMSKKKVKKKKQKRSSKFNSVESEKGSSPKKFIKRNSAFISPKIKIIKKKKKKKTKKINQDSDSQELKLSHSSSSSSSSSSFSNQESEIDTFEDIDPQIYEKSKNGLIIRRHKTEKTQLSFVQMNTLKKVINEKNKNNANDSEKENENSQSILSISSIDEKEEIKENIEIKKETDILNKILSNKETNNLFNLIMLLKLYLRKRNKIKETKKDIHKKRDEIKKIMQNFFRKLLLKLTIREIKEEHRHFEVLEELKRLKKFGVYSSKDLEELEKIILDERKNDVKKYEMGFDTEKDINSLKIRKKSSNILPIFSQKLSQRLDSAKSNEYQFKKEKKKRKSNNSYLFKNKNENDIRKQSKTDLKIKKEIQDILNTDYGNIPMKPKGITFLFSNKKKFHNFSKRKYVRKPTNRTFLKINDELLDEKILIKSKKVSEELEQKLKREEIRDKRIYEFFSKIQRLKKEGLGNDELNTFIDQQIEHNNEIPKEKNGGRLNDFLQEFHFNRIRAKYITDLKNKKIGFLSPIIFTSPNEAYDISK